MQDIKKRLPAGSPKTEYLDLQQVLALSDNISFHWLIAGFENRGLVRKP